MARVYITAIGQVSALGDSASARRAFASGACALRLRTLGRFHTALGSLDAASEQRLLSLAGTDELDRSVRLGLLAARDALRCAPRSPSAIFFGSSRGATTRLEDAHTEFLAAGRVPPRTSPSTTLGNLASNIARDVAANGADVAFELSSACSSSLLALLMAVTWLRAGMGEVCLAGGAEAALTPFTLAQFEALGLLCRGEACEYPCRPFSSQNQSSLVLGEGACALLLERLDDDAARMRGALAEIVGVASAVERPPSATGVSPNGDGLLRAMRGASTGLGGPPDAIVVHAPGTPRGDRAELAACRTLFGHRLPALCSNKWLLGHTFGASGALSVELALALLAGERVASPPFESLLTSPEQVPRSVLVNALGFGGLAISVALRAVSPDTV